MVTAGQVLAVAQAAESIATGVASLDLKSLPSDAALAEDVLAAVAIFWPPAALIELGVAIAVDLAPALSITPDPNPIADAQTTPSRAGRSG